MWKTPICISIHTYIYGYIKFYWYLKRMLFNILTLNQSTNQLNFITNTLWNIYKDTCSSTWDPSVLFHLLRFQFRNCFKVKQTEIPIHINSNDKIGNKSKFPSIRYTYTLLIHTPIHRFIHMCVQTHTLIPEYYPSYLVGRPTTTNDIENHNLALNWFYIIMGCISHLLAHTEPLLGSTALSIAKWNESDIGVSSQFNSIESLIALQQ